MLARSAVEPLLTSADPSLVGAHQREALPGKSGEWKMARIVVLGGGICRSVAAIGAGRKLDEIGQAAEVEILVIDRNPRHNIRVRNYEVDLSEVAIPLAGLLILSALAIWSPRCKGSTLSDKE